MAAQGVLTDRLALDVKGVDDLRRAVRQDPDKGLKEVARQFESLLMQMMLKSMRDASPQEGLFDSEQTKLYGSMLDQQFAQVMAKRGIGLAEIMANQLASRGREAAGVDGAVDRPDSVVPGSAPAVPAGGVPGGPTAPAPGAAGVEGTPRGFVDRLWPHAVEASKTTGIPPHFMIAQAALESGWGRREIRMPDGSTSHNLFGIKATGNWKGASAETATTEYVAGQAVRTTEKFRAYGSYEEAFRDYAKLLRDNPRYAGVLDAGADASGFARGLQRAGYATDPMYAAKLERIIQSSALRQALAG